MFKPNFYVVIFGLSICNTAEAATLDFSGHSKTISVSSYNTHYTPGFGVDSVGALPGAADTYQDENLNGAIVFTETFGYGPDAYGRINNGSASGVIVSASDGGAHTIVSRLSPTVDGEAAPQISMGSSSETAFTVDSDTYAAISVDYEGSTPFTNDYVSARLLEIDPETGDVVAYPFQLAGKIPGVNVSREGDFSVLLRADREYVLETEGSARANASSSYGTNDHPSSLSITIAPTQDLDGNSEANALKPANAASFGTEANVSNTALFSLDAVDVALTGTIWLDPEIAVGYDYLVYGSDIAAITLPDLSTVYDLDGYDVFDADGEFLSHVLPGETFIFTDPTHAFSLGDISPTLELDPTQVGLFALGLDFVNITEATITVHQTPITEFVSSVPAVPLPAGLPLLLVGIGGLFVAGRRSN